MKTLKVNFFIDNTRLNSEGLAPIRVRSKHNSDKLVVRQTGHFIDPKKFKAGKAQDHIIQKKLDELTYIIKDTYEQLTRGNDSVTLSDVWETMYPDKANKPILKSQKIVDWIEYYRQNQPYSYEYLRGAEDIRIQLTGKNKDGKKIGKGYRPSLMFKELNQTVIDGLSTHMVRHNSCTTGQVVKVIKHLRQMAKMAQDLKIEVGSTSFKAPKNFNKKAASKIRLTFEEIIRIKNTDVTGTEVEIRDMFLFMCFTGLRHSDFIRLKKQDDQGDFLDLEQSKTSEAVFVTMNKYSKHIFNKYSKGKSDTDRVFPEYSQATFNNLIKTVCRKAGLNDLVTNTKYYGAEVSSETKKKYLLVASHTGRRTCARILSLLQVPEDIIAEELGHSTANITRHYIGNAEHQKRIDIIQDAWNRAESFFTPKAVMRKIQ